MVPNIVSVPNGAEKMHCLPILDRLTSRGEARGGGKGGRGMKLETREEAGREEEG